MGEQYVYTIGAYIVSNVKLQYKLAQWCNEMQITLALYRGEIIYIFSQGVGKMYENGGGGGQS